VDGSRTSEKTISAYSRYRFVTIYNVYSRPVYTNPLLAGGTYGRVYIFGNCPKCSFAARVERHGADYVFTPYGIKCGRLRKPTVSRRHGRLYILGYIFLR